MQHLFGAAEHGANFPKARELRAHMTHEQLHDFAATPTKNLPEHAHKETARKNLYGAGR